MFFARLLLRNPHHRRLPSSTCLFSSTTSGTATSIPRPNDSTSTLRPINTVIDSLRNERNLDSFLSRFHFYSASSPRFRSDNSIYELAVRRLAAAGRYDDVAGIVDALKPLASEDSTVPFYPSRMISLYGKAGMHTRACETFRELPRSTRTFNALLSALGSDGGVLGAFETIPTEYPEIVPDVYSYGIVIKALCDKGDFDEAMEVLGLMEEKGVAPNVVTFSTLLDAFYKNERYDEAEKVWGIMGEKNCLDARSFNSKLKWLVDSGRTPEAVKLFTEMKSRGLKPDGYGMTSLIVGHCKDGNLKEAKKIFGQIRRQNCSRNPLMYETLVPKVRESREINFALSLCHESMKNKCYVSAEVLQAVVDDLVKASKFDDATNLVKAAWSSCHYSKGSVKIPKRCLKTKMNQQRKKEEAEQQKEKVELLEQRNDAREEVPDECFSEEQREQEKQAKKAYCKIGIIVKSFEKPKYLGAFGIPLDKNRVKLPTTRTLITVLRSPHIDKKSREQFEMKVRREYIVIKCEPHELHKKYFWFKRTRILGAQFELVFSYKTRLDMSRLRSSS